jgi:hypothetical protein
VSQGKNGGLIVVPGRCSDSMEQTGRSIDQYPCQLEYFENLIKTKACMTLAAHVNLIGSECRHATCQQLPNLAASDHSARWRHTLSGFR